MCNDYRIRTDWKERFDLLQNGKPKVNKKLLQECLRYMFAFHSNVEFNKYGYRNERFPECLTEASNEKAKKVIALLKIHKSAGEVADTMDAHRMTIYSIISNYEDALRFYAKWNVFWSFIQPIRKRNVSEMLNEFFSNSELSKMEKKGIITMEEYFNVYLKHKNRERCNILGQRKSEDTETICQYILEVCCALLEEQEQENQK